MDTPSLQKCPFHQRTITDIFFLKQDKDKVRSKTPYEKKMDNMSIEGRSNYSKNNKDSFVFGIDKVNYFKTSYKESQKEIEKETNKQRALTKPKYEDKDKDNDIHYYPKVNTLIRMKTTSGLFAKQKNSRENKMELYKSNIFNDPVKDIMNKTFTITPDILKQEKQKTLNPVRNIRRRIVKNDNDDDHIKINLTEADTARERKKENNKGHFPSEYNDYKPKPPPKEMASVDEPKKRELIRKYEGLSENQRQAEDYVITGSKDMDLQDIQKVFHENGLHIFHQRDETSYYDGQNNARITFKLRACEEDKAYQGKVDAVKTYLKKQKGLNVKKVDPSSKDYFFKGYCPTQTNSSRTNKRAAGDDEKPRWKF